MQKNDLHQFLTSCNQLLLLAGSVVVLFLTGLIPVDAATVDLLGIFLIQLALTFYGCSHHCFAFDMLDVAMYILSGAS